MALPRETFHWLTPRARSAGAAAPMRYAFGALGASDVPWRAAVGDAPARPPALPEGVLADEAAPAPDAALGRRLSLLFDGEGRWYAGQVVAHDRRRDRHLLLFDDAEDEWVSLAAETVVWHKEAADAGGEGEGAAVAAPTRPLAVAGLPKGGRRESGGGALADWLVGLLAGSVAVVPCCTVFAAWHSSPTPIPSQGDRMTRSLP